MTKKLKRHGKEDPQDDKDIDIFDRIEKLSYDFVLRLRKHELEHSHSEEILTAVSTDQQAIQNAIVRQLNLYE